MAPLDSPQDFTADPVWVSLARALQFYNLTLDPALARAQIPVDWHASLTAVDALKICKHLHLDANHRLMRPKDVEGLAMAAVVWLPDGAALAYLPGEMLPVMDSETVFNVITIEYLAENIEESDSAGQGLVWFWQPFWEYKKDYIDLALATFFINMFALAIPIYTKNVYDRVVPNHANETLFALTLGITFVFGFNLAFKMVRGRILELVAAKLAARLDADLMDRLLRLRVPEQRLTIGEKSDLFRELQGLRDFFATRLMPAILDLPFFLMFLIVIYLISPGLLPVVIVGIIAMFVTSFACSASINKAADTQFQSTRRKNAVLVEMLSGATAIRLFNAAGKQLLGWTRIAERTATTAQHSQHRVELAGDISITITYLVSVFIVVVGVFEIEKGQLSVGGLIAGSILVSRAIAPVMTLSMVAGRFRQSLDSLKVIDRIFHLPVESRVAADYAGKAPFSGAVELQDVVYYHPGQSRPTLYHLSLAIRPGEKVGLIGRTGAGKSTVLHLLEGSIQPQSGLVLADELVLDAIHPAEWRGSLGIVPQESFFFAGSVRDNILLGHDGPVDEDWFQTVLLTSGLDQLLRQAGYGVDFQVGEGGQRLSGGQRQSVAIARALIRRPGLLLLDEPTNGMDNELERQVVRALRDFARNSTLILVTHRTPLLELVDRLILVDQGKVAADGPRDEVLKMLAGRGRPNA